LKYGGRLTVGRRSLWSEMQAHTLPAGPLIVVKTGRQCFGLHCSRKVDGGQYLKADFPGRILGGIGWTFPRLPASKFVRRLTASSKNGIIHGALGGIFATACHHGIAPTPKSMARRRIALRLRPCLIDRACGSGNVLAEGEEAVLGNNVFQFNVRV